MSDTRLNIHISANSWVDIYDQSNIAIGKQVSVYNVGASDVFIAISENQPAKDSDAFIIIKPGGLPFTNHIGDSGLWAFSGNCKGLLNVTKDVKTINTESIIVDSAGRENMIALTGDQIVGFRLDDISVNFQYGISTNDIKDGGSVTGTGEIGHTGSMATVTAGTGIGSATITSRSAIRYRAGHQVMGAITCVFHEPEINLKQYAGFLNDDDAWCVGYDSLDFGIWFIRGGVIDFIKQSDFNIDKLDGSGDSGYNINPQTMQLYLSTYAWHGSLPLRIEIYNPDTSKWVVCHKVEIINSAIDTHLKNPNLPIAFKIERVSGNGVLDHMCTGSWRGGIISGAEQTNVGARWFADFILNRTKTAQGDHAITIRSKDIFNGIVNHIKTEVKIIVSTNGTNKDLVFKATKLSNLSPSEQTAITSTFVDVDSNNSVIEFTNVETQITSDPPFIDVAVIQAGSQRGNTNVEGLDLYAGEDIVFFVDDVGSNSNGTFSFQMNHRELF